MFAGCAGLIKGVNSLTILIFTLNSFTVKGKDGEPYSYIFQVCGDAGGKNNAGLVQKNEKTNVLVRIGNYNQTRAIKGSMLRCLTSRMTCLLLFLFLLQVDFSEPIMVFSIFFQLALCPAALLPELQPASCFLSAIIGQID